MSLIVNMIKFALFLLLAVVSLGWFSDDKHHFKGCFCTMQYDPVYHKGKKYSNYCMAKCANPVSFQLHRK